MKSFLTLALTALTGFGLYAQNPVTIKGTLDQEFSRTVKLYKVVEGDMVEIASSVPQEGKNLDLTFMHPMKDSMPLVRVRQVAKQTMRRFILNLATNWRSI